MDQPSLPMASKLKKKNDWGGGEGGAVEAEAGSKARRKIATKYDGELEKEGGERGLASNT